MRQSETINKLLEAICKAQAEFTTLPKDKSGYGYKYTDLDTVICSVRPILAKYGLGFMQSLTTLESGKSGITTRVFSAAGEYIEDTVTLPEITVGKTNAAQNLGAAITYMKRYALCAILGISSDEDVDANTTPRQETKTENNQNQNPFKGMSRAAQLERNKSVQQKQPPQLAGGPDTIEEHEKINALLSAKGADGKPLFDRGDFKMVETMRKEKTAVEVITFLEATLSNMRGKEKAVVEQELIEQPEIF